MTCSVLFVVIKESFVRLSSFHLLTDLDALSMQIAARLGLKKVEAVKNVIIWGNHSSTQYPDVNHGTVTDNGAEVPIRKAVKDDTYLNGEFITVRMDKPFFYYLKHKTLRLFIGAPSIDRPINLDFHPRLSSFALG